MKKKILAILLAAIMVMSMIPTVAFAETEYTYTLSLDSARAVYVVGDSNSIEGTTREWANENWLDKVTLAFLDDDGYKALFECDTWAEFYPALETEISDIKMTGTAGAFECKTDEKTTRWLLLVLDDATELTAGAPFKVYCGTSSAEGGEITLDTTPIATGNLRTDAPSNSKGAEITGKIDIADFGYEMIIPSETVLTEAKHTDVLLGTHGDVMGDGKVYINVTKHPATNVDVFYTVTLGDAATLNDGNGNTITTTYGVSTNGTNFSALAENTKYTVYTGGEKVDSFINVTAADEAGDGVKLWKDAPVGDYNATVVFNFDDEENTAPTCACGVDLEEYSKLLKVVGIDDSYVYMAEYKYEENAFNLLYGGRCYGWNKDELSSDYELTEYAIGDYFHINGSKDVIKCTSSSKPGSTDVVFTVTENEGSTNYYAVPAGTNYTISADTLEIEALLSPVIYFPQGTWVLNGGAAPTSGIFNDGDAFVVTENVRPEPKI